MGAVRLRHVVETDIDVFFVHQRDPEAARMAVFTGRERHAFREHWRKIVADGNVVARTILDGDAVVGHVVAWEEESGRLLVGYWIGRDHWGRGIGTAALSQLLEQVTRRPLYAQVARSNAGSIRVLEKCGFTAVGSELQTDHTHGVFIELLFALE
jgi:RimJ/RimL family protein N-acetyltransferase